ncbi:hypothetical protein SLS53_006064 [Cytospora paraplurivora]|uniref:Bud22 domain-containing protein n=1 Tax=Cytospora paraplurivora TaxID=2898453 RepID=A0AAN9U6N4_9PEZI
MPKRKRNEVDEKLELHQTALFRALKVAKGFERQRMAKRQRDPKSTPDKKARIEKEVEVLKSLDLHSVAHAHLCSSLLKIKAVAESPRLPDEIKNGVPKPDLTEEERIALHNVTSGLYNQSKVRDALEKAIVAICGALRVPVPDKKGKVKKGDKITEQVTGKDPEEQPADRPVGSASALEKKKVANKTETLDKADESSDEDDTEWNGLSDGEEDAKDEEQVEDAISRFDDRLGSSDSEEVPKKGEHNTAKEELDPMEITDESASEESEGDLSLGDSESDEEDEDEDDETDNSVEDGSSSESGSDASAISPPPKVSRKGAQPKNRAERGFLPSLMGGYISGSESEASDIDVAPTARKNRRGQRARQAIWEKKFKEQAKHLAQEKFSRDSGWDLKRGAVDGNARTPWKTGIRTPFEKRSVGHHGEQQAHAAAPQQPKEPRKKDNEGSLHPSWEARKKAKEAQETAAYQGKRITFD